MNSKELLLILLINFASDCSSPCTDFKDKYCYSYDLRVVVRPISLQPLSLLYPFIFKSSLLFSYVESEIDPFPFIEDLKQDKSFGYIVNHVFLSPAGIMGEVSVKTATAIADRNIANTNVLWLVWFMDIVYLALLSYFLVRLWKRAWWGKIIFIFFISNKILFIAYFFLDGLFSR